MTLEQELVTEGSADSLVIRARTDRDAFGQLYDSFYPAVLRYCVRRLFVRAVAEDVASDVFLQVAAKMTRFPGSSEEDFRRWLFRIATNQVNAYLRQTRRRRALLASAMAARGGTPQGEAEVEAADWPTLYQAILRLNPRQQAIVSLRFFEHMSFEQIGGVLGQRSGTVRVALSRALEKLRRCLTHES